jgi:hemoglobin
MGGLPNDTPYRRAVRSHIELGARVAQQNSRATTDEALYPRDHVPLWEWEGDDEASGSS